jgi:hypothetical protein
MYRPLDLQRLGHVEDRVRLPLLVNHRPSCAVVNGTEQLSGWCKFMLGQREACEPLLRKKRGTPADLVGEVSIAE